MPTRIQLRRTKGWRMPAGTVKVDRTTAFGNPWRVGEAHCPTAAEAVRMFRARLPGAEFYIPPHLLPDYLAASAWAGRLERRLKRHREWPERFEREMARDGMGMPPPDYLLRRSQ